MAFCRAHQIGASEVPRSQENCEEEAEAKNRRSDGRELEVFVIVLILPMLEAVHQAEGGDKQRPVRRGVQKPMDDIKENNSGWPKRGWGERDTRGLKLDAASNDGCE